MQSIVPGCLMSTVIRETQLGLEALQEINLLDIDLDYNHNFADLRLNNRHKNQRRPAT